MTTTTHSVTVTYTVARIIAELTWDGQKPIISLDTFLEGGGIEYLLNPSTFGKDRLQVLVRSGNSTFLFRRYLGRVEGARYPLERVTQALQALSGMARHEEMFIFRGELPIMAIAKATEEEHERPSVDLNFLAMADHPQTTAALASIKARLLNKPQQMSLTEFLKPRYLKTLTTSPSHLSSTRVVAGRGNQRHYIFIPRDFMVGFTPPHSVEWAEVKRCQSPYFAITENGRVLGFFIRDLPRERGEE